MATLHVRNVPDELYERLKSLAGHNHRSLSAEVIDLLEAEVAARDRVAQMTRALEGLEKVRRRLPPVSPGYAADLVRESRGAIVDH
jgi:plasmid stability protein